MKINKSSKTYKKIVVIGAIVLIAAPVCGAWYVHQQQSKTNTPTGKETKPENTVNYDTATEQEKTAGLQAKEDFAKRVESQPAKPDTPEVPSTGSGATSAAVPVTITSAAVQEGTLQVRAIVSAAAAEGQCRLRMTKAGQAEVIRQAELMAMNSYFICKGFDIDAASLAKGEWQVAVLYSGNAGAGRADKVVAIP